jgi:hypothetical protein
MFRGQKVPGQARMKSLTVTGGAVAIAAMLKEEMDWNELTPMAVPLLVVDSAGRIRSTRWTAFGALKTCAWSCSNIWENADKTVKLVLRINDLKEFTWPANSNISLWNDRSEMEVSFVRKVGRETPVVLDWDQAREYGVGNVSFRCILIPTGPTESALWIAATTRSTAELRDIFTAANMSKPYVPRITMPMKSMETEENTTGKAVLTKLMVPEEDGEEFGMGVLALMDITAGSTGGSQAPATPEAPLPSGEDYKEATLMFLRKVEMGNNTTAVGIETKFASLDAGSFPSMRKPNVVFPHYKSRVSLDRPLGEFDFLLVLYPGVLGRNKNLSLQ